MRDATKPSFLLNGGIMAIYRAITNIRLGRSVFILLCGAFLSISIGFAQTAAAGCDGETNEASTHSGNFYSGETHFQVTQLQQTCGLLTSTHLVVVRQLQGDKTAVSADQSVAGRLQTRLFVRKDPSSVEATDALAQQVRKSFIKSIVANLAELHFATDVDSQLKTDERDAIIIQVEMTQIDAGNKSKRVMIGLGRGASEVTAKVTVISRHHGKEVPFEEILLDSESGKKLGALTSPLGGASAVSVAEGDVGDRKSSPQADATRMAKGLAQYLGKLVAASNTGQQSGMASMPSLEK